MSPNHVQRKHQHERELVVDEALRSSMRHLSKAHHRFGAVIQDQGLQDEFTDGISKAQEVLWKLGIDE